MLFDTSKIIEMIKSDQFKPGHITVITLIEILRGIKGDKRDKVKKLLEEIFDILPIDNNVILEYCNLYDKLKEKGQLLPDADLIIAATAKAYDLELATEDKDFLRLEEYNVKVKVN